MTTATNDAATCSRCGDGPIFCIEMGVVAETHAGTIEPLCLACLSDPDGLRADVPMIPHETGPRRHRQAFKKNKATSREQEVDIADELGWRTQPGSGNQAGAKGDVRGKGVGRVEAKFTTAASFSLKLEELEKIAGECTGFEVPVFVIDFLESGTRKLRDRFAVLNFHHLKGLLHGSR